MCGIVGYVGDKSAVDIILDGLKRLEYRGYDSAGIAVARRGRPARSGARPGRIKSARGHPARAADRAARIGIGHTRWATHGRPSDENAHPHTDCSGRRSSSSTTASSRTTSPIKERLQAEGHVFRSETDTEVIAHLDRASPRGRADGSTRRCARALARVPRLLRASVVLSTADARTGWSPPSTARAASSSASAAARCSSPPTSRPSSSHTRDVVILEDDEVAVVTRRGRRAHARSTARPVQREPVAHPVGSDHGREGRLPALHAQGDLRAAARHHRHLPRPRRSPRPAPSCCPTSSSIRDDAPAIQRVVLVACGTSYHAAMRRAAS